MRDMMILGDIQPKFGTKLVELVLNSKDFWYFREIQSQSQTFFLLVVC